MNSPRDLADVRLESILDANPVFAESYFLRKADSAWINKWLLERGFMPITESPGTKTWVSGGGSTPSSPGGRSVDSVFFADAKHHRNNSKKHLRQDFAKSKAKNVFRTFEPKCASLAGLATRRNSLKEMRQCQSLPPTSLNILSMLLQSKVKVPRYPSKDEDSKRVLKESDERSFFLDIVKDISNDLDLRSLSAKTIANMVVLVDADKGSLFFVESIGGERVLLSKQFDVHCGATVVPPNSADWTVQVPWGEGVIGYVAESGETVNLTNVSQDPRFYDDLGKASGYKTRTLLCTPIRNADDEIIAVAQVINKHGAVNDSFTVDDEKILQTYLTFCGVAIHNAQIFESYSKEYERNRALLEVVHEMFEEQLGSDDVILKIMKKAQTLLKCERCSVLLKDTTSENAFSKVYDLSTAVKNGVKSTGLGDCADLKLGNEIAELVLTTGETISISDAYSDSRFDPNLDLKSGMTTRNILCRPIRNNEFKIIGVAQLVNKKDAYAFDDHDSELFEVFVIFCGLGISNAMLYEEVLRASAKQNVALEMLSYHAAAPEEDYAKFKVTSVPEARAIGLDDLRFNDFVLDRDEMVMASIRIFTDLRLICNFRINYETLVRWLLTVKRNYRDVPYHNWRHAFNVCQMMFAIVKNSRFGHHLTKHEVLSLIVACLCHDLDHRGTNNAFQQKSSSALAQLYGTRATMEHHHFNHAVMILNSSTHNILANLSSEDYTTVISLLKQAILATDITLHLQLRDTMFAIADLGAPSWGDTNDRSIVRDVLMTACDVAAITKPWDVQSKVAKLVVSEFFAQGDQERRDLNLQPQAIMDREKRDDVPKLQLQWIDAICLPLYQALGKLDPSLACLIDGVNANRIEWEKLDKKRSVRQMIRRTIIETCV